VWCEQLHLSLFHRGEASLFEEFVLNKKIKNHEVINIAELPTAMSPAFIGGARGMTVDNSYRGRHAVFY
jgi:hypothetical protein